MLLRLRPSRWRSFFELERDDQPELRANGAPRSVDKVAEAVEEFGAEVSAARLPSAPRPLLSGGVEADECGIRRRGHKSRRSRRMRKVPTKPTRQPSAAPSPSTPSRGGRSTRRAFSIFAEQHQAERLPRDLHGAGSVRQGRQPSGATSRPVRVLARCRAAPSASVLPNTNRASCFGELGLAPRPSGRRRAGCRSASFGIVHAGLEAGQHGGHGVAGAVLTDHTALELGGQMRVRAQALSSADQALRQARVTSEGVSRRRSGCAPCRWALCGGCANQSRQNERFPGKSAVLSVEG